MFFKQGLQAEKTVLRTVKRTMAVCLCLSASFLVTLAPAKAADTPLWGQFRASFTDSTWSGNPFDVDFSATFTHTETDRSLTQFGFYAGDNTWKVFFMPDATGTWEYVTQSPDADLSGNTGTFTVTDSARLGPLKPSGTRWKFSDGGFAQPVLVPSRQYIKSSSISDLLPFVDWIDKTVEANVLGTTLVYFNHGQEAEPYEEGFEGQRFYLPVWNRLNALYDELSTRDIGLYIMFFSDDAESPSRNGIPEGLGGTISVEEERLFKYAVARFGAYPTVIWDTGIDIGETRTATWQENFAAWFAANDPWGHPVGNRNGGGSGGIQPESATYHSDGSSTLRAAADYIATWKSRTVPTIFTDRWRENYSRGGFDPKKIREAVWQMSLIGGTGVYVSGDENGGYLTATYASDFEAAASVGYVGRFFRTNAVDMGELSPRQDLLLSGSAVVAASLTELVAYLPTGGDVDLDLSTYGQDLRGVWYNPRTGIIDGEFSASGGATLSRQAPSAEDWVLWLSGDSGSAARPKPPKSVTVD